MDGDAGGRAHGSVPSGIVTFLFTDVEGSTRLWAEDRDAMAASLAFHDEILRQTFESRDGYVFSTAGDSFAVAFGLASDAVAAADAAQAALRSAAWPGPELRVRMGLHLGEARERGGDYFGPVVNLTARLEAAGHGGQILLTDPVRQAADVRASDLGVHGLRDFSEPVQIWQLGDDVFPPLRVIDAGLTNLPVTVTSLVGRVEALHGVREALRSSRVVTLIAGGGGGKTRLAIAAGEAELPDRPDGVWFVDLTPVSEGALAASAVADGLGLSLLAGDPIEQILEYVANKELLLIVDNCEHLIDECAEFAERFLARAGASVMLTTSRERLDIEGERSLRVPPLSSDGHDSPAVDLFVERAEAVNSSFVLADEERPVVAELCDRLDGMPLAIELAAARSTVMTPVELLAGISDRFQLLHGGRRRQRQRTLEATMDWSYGLLDDDEQATLRALGVFVGTFDLDAVAAVTNSARHIAVELIDSLIAKSLVVHVETDGHSRFRLFETTAAYAQQRLADTGQAEAIRDRHLEHYLDLSRRHPLAMFADIAARNLLGADKPNIVSAFEWAGSQQRWATAAELLLGTFTVFYDQPTEGIALVERCITKLSADDHDLTMRLVSNRWFLHILVYNMHAAEVAAHRLRDSPTALHQAVGASLLGIHSGIRSARAATPILDQAKAITETLSAGPDRIQASTLWRACAAMICNQRGQYEAALDHAQAAITLHNELGFESEWSAQALTQVAMNALMLGDPRTALEAADRYRRLSHVVGTGDETTALAHIALGDLDQARAATRRHSRDAATGRVMHRAGDTIMLLAALANAEGDPALARNLLVDRGLGGQPPHSMYARWLAEQLGIGTEYAANRALLQSDLKGDSVRRSAAADAETVRREMARRGWQ